MISEESCDNEDCQLCITGINDILKYSQAVIFLNCNIS